MLKSLTKQMASLDGLNLPPVTQIGMVVPDLFEGVRLYRNFLGIPKWYHTVITDCSYYYRNKPIDILLDIAVGYSGKTQIELIQVKGSDDNIYRAHPGEAGFGFHHFGVVVDNLENARRIMWDRGFAPLQEGTLKYAGGGKTKVAYLDTIDKAGLILELIETKAFGLNMGMPQWLINLGRITGDTKSIPA
jgi:hypothetical protein